MATSRNLDKGGLVLRFTNMSDDPITAMTFYFDQEDITSKEVSFSPAIEKGETVEIKLPYDDLKSESYIPGEYGIEIEIEFLSNDSSIGMCYVYYNPTYSPDASFKTSSIIDISTGGWYYAKIFM